MAESEELDLNRIVNEFLEDKEKNSMLLYGLSGSGKSTYLRHLERRILKQFID